MSSLAGSSGSASVASGAAITTVTPLIPPVARRDDDRVVYAGVAPDGWDMKIPRQAETSTEALLDPPVAVPDPYGWLRDETRTNVELVAHLTAENAYTHALTRHLQDTEGDKGLVSQLYEEMLSVIQETDYTTPRPDQGYVYYTRTIQGLAYTVHCRAPKPAIAGGKMELQWTSDMNDQVKGTTPVLLHEQVILDVNQLAVGQSYCSTGSVKKSPSQNLLAYAVDFTGDEKCLLFVKDLATDTVIHQDPTLEIYGSLTWGADDSTLFYLQQDAAQRPFQVYRRTLSKDGDVLSHSDEMIWEELDDSYWVGCYKSKDGRYLFVESSSKETTEIHFLDLHDATATLQCIARRRPKVLYEVEHRDGLWWISSNVGSLPNMALFTAPAQAQCEGDWKLVTLSDRVLFDGGYERSLDSVQCFARHVVASGREGGLPRVWIIGVAASSSSHGTAVVQHFERLAFAEEACDVSLGTNYEFDATSIVVAYDSMVTPTQSIEIDMKDTTQRTVLKEKHVPGYEKELYRCERVTVTSRDGTTQIPVSLVYRKDVMEQHVSSGQPVPVHLYGYGSYGACMEASFVATRLPLLNRGMVYVIAHVRGGGEMGRTWYEEPNGAKYLCKKNTFNDFVDVAQWLLTDRKLTTSNLLSCEGRSAGGLLIGASINQAPELFRVAILGVPFVDVVPTMIDASIPLTMVEYEEWGNPNEQKYHDYMMEYNPITNVQKAKYPACLLTGGLHDPRVQYWEPAKFAAELRHSQGPDSGPVCLKIDMNAGHFSASDRYKYLKEKAFDYAFILDQLGIANNR